MEIVQKKRSNKHTFVFRDNHFNFAYKDKSGSGDSDLQYGALPKKTSIQIEQNEWIRNVGYLWCVIGVFQLGRAIYSQAALAGTGFWLVMGLACLAWYFFTKIRYTVFKSDQGNVFVIHEKNHDKIIEELKSRRKSQLLVWYGDVNPENELAREIDKFKWLVEQEVITKEESENKIAQAELFHKKSFEIPGERIN